MNRPYINLPRALTAIKSKLWRYADGSIGLPLTTSTALTPSKTATFINLNAHDTVLNPDSIRDSTLVLIKKLLIRGHINFAAATTTSTSPYHKGCYVRIILFICHDVKGSLPVWEELFNTKTSDSATTMTSPYLYQAFRELHETENFTMLYDKDHWVGWNQMSADASSTNKYYSGSSKNVEIPITFKRPLIMQFTNTTSTASSACDSNGIFMFAIQSEASPGTGMFYFNTRYRFQNVQ